MKKTYKGFMLINSFLKSGKFEEIYSCLKNAFTASGITLDVLSGAELFLDSEQCSAADKYDFCLFWDKDIYLARLLEEKGLRLFNSSYGVAVCDDKWLTYEVLKKHNVPMPETISVPFTYENVGYNSFEFIDKAGSELSWPFVIKENKGSFGGQVYLAHNRAEAETILKNIAGKPAICQRFISESAGHDIRINMVGEKAAAAMERISDDDFRANITAGGHMKEHAVTDTELLLARQVMRYLKLDFAGVDILISDAGPLLCEVNSNAHFKNIFDLTGINVADAIAEYIKNAVYGESEQPV